MQRLQIGRVQLTTTEDNLRCACDHFCCSHILHLWPRHSCVSNNITANVQNSLISNLFSRYRVPLYTTSHVMIWGNPGSRFNPFPTCSYVHLSTYDLIIHIKSTSMYLSVLGLWCDSWLRPTWKKNKNKNSQISFSPMFTDFENQHRLHDFDKIFLEVTFFSPPQWSYLSRWNVQKHVKEYSWIIPSKCHDYSQYNCCYWIYVSGITIDSIAWPQILFKLNY